VSPAGFGEQGEDGVDLAPLEGAGKALHQLSHPRVGERPRRRVLAWLRQPLLDCPAGTEQRAVDRCDRGLKRLCRFLGGEAEYVAEDEHGPLTRGEVLRASGAASPSALPTVTSECGSIDAPTSRGSLGGSPGLVLGP
jgi:hypothetical protein